MLFILSTLVPDEMKTKSWLLWDRRETWLVCRAYYRDFQEAYLRLKFHEEIIALSKQIQEEARRRESV